MRVGTSMWGSGWRTEEMDLGGWYMRRRGISMKGSSWGTTDKDRAFFTATAKNVFLREFFEEIRNQGMGKSCLWKSMKI